MMHIGALMSGVMHMMRLIWGLLALVENMVFCDTVQNNKKCPM